MNFSDDSLLRYSSSYHLHLSFALQLFSSGLEAWFVFECKATQHHPLFLTPTQIQSQMEQVYTAHSHNCFSCLLVSLLREYVSSKTINKVVQVHDRIFCCMSGSLADAQAVTKAAKFQLSFHRCTTDSSAGQCSVTFQAPSVLSYLSQYPDGEPSTGGVGGQCAEGLVLQKPRGAAGWIHHCRLGLQERTSGEVTRSHTHTLRELVQLTACGPPAGVRRGSGRDATQAACHHWRLGQHLHLRLRRCQIQSQHEQRGMPPVRHQWYSFVCPTTEIENKKTSDTVNHF